MSERWTKVEDIPFGSAQRRLAGREPPRRRSQPRTQGVLSAAERSIDGRSPAAAATDRQPYSEGRPITTEQAEVLERTKALDGDRAADLVDAIEALRERERAGRPVRKRGADGRFVQ
jgi:protein-disulfide isomerase-like protein with CxxC motif